MKQPLKTECIYRHKPATFSEANEMIDRYIHFYNHERIQTQNRNGAADTAPLLLKLYIPAPGAFLCCLHNLGRFIPALRGLLPPVTASSVRPVPLG